MSLSEQGIQPGEPLGKPTLRLLDLVNGNDQILAEGAASVAWSSNGRLAYVQGQPGTYRADEPWTGNVAVRDGPLLPPNTWTNSPAHYVVAAWAGPRLLVHRLGTNGRLDVLVLDGPGRLRELGPGSLVAVSPDATKAFLEETAYRPQVRVVDLATGNDIARLNLSTNALHVQWLLYAGDWHGDAIVASASPGLAVFRFSGADLRLDHVIAVDQDRYQQGVLEPHFINASTTDIVGWAPLGSPEATETIPTVALHCVPNRGCVADSPRPERSVHPISNPSRPLAVNPRQQPQKGSR